MLYGAIFGFLSLAGGVLLYFIRRDARSLGKEEADNETMRRINEQISSRPLTDDDFLNRLHTIENIKRKNQSDS